MPEYIDVEDEEIEEDENYYYLEGTTLHIPGVRLLHEASQYCWCNPKVYRYTDGSFDVEHNFFEQ